MEICIPTNKKSTGREGQCFFSFGGPTRTIPGIALERCDGYTLPGISCGADIDVAGVEGDCSLNSR